MVGGRLQLGVTLEDMLHARDVPQNTDEWLGLRSGIFMREGVVYEWKGQTVGASASAGMIGWSKYDTAEDLFRKVTGDIPGPVMGAPPGKFCPLRHGHELEDATMVAYALAVSTIPEGGVEEQERIRMKLVRESWETKKGRRALPYPALPSVVYVKPTGIYFSPEVPYMHASVDGLILRVSSGGVAIATSAEAKSPVFRVYDSIPVSYLVQMMHQKLVVVLSFMDEVTMMSDEIRADLEGRDELLAAFEVWAEGLADGKDKDFAKRLFAAAEEAAAEGREFTAADVEDMEADIEFMACWWANEGNDVHPYVNCKSVCAHLRVWRIKYNHAFAMELKAKLNDFTDAVNEDPPSLDDPRIWRKRRARLSDNEEAHTFHIARVCEAMVTSDSLAAERGAPDARPCFTPDVTFPLFEQFDGQRMVRDEHGVPMVVPRPDKVPEDAKMHVRWYDGEFGAFTIEEVDEGAEGIAMSTGGP